MNASISKLKKRRKIFGWVFVVSFVVFMVLNLVFFVSLMDDFVDSHGYLFGSRHHADVGIAVEANFAIILSVISFLTSLTALLGFFFTTVLAWRKEKRDERHSELELRKKELEIKTLQADLKEKESNITN